MRILPLTLLVPLALTFYATAHAENSAQQQFCHNGVCWDIGGPGDIGSPCCPFSVEPANNNVQRPENPTDNPLKLHGVTLNWNKTDQADKGMITQAVQ
ncbi:hypothetical protein V0M98_14695 [Pseudomonas silesiensis]|uniref:hypothetical protein n=1 Tax=Pseudomonas silesiensis TaxID=1853130 RepID=UPI0030D2C151